MCIVNTVCSETAEPFKVLMQIICSLDCSVLQERFYQIQQENVKIS